MFHPDQRPNFSLHPSKLVVFVDGSPLSQLPCPAELLIDEDVVRMYRWQMEATATRRGELVMPFKETLELSVLPFDLSINPEINDVMRRQRRLKLAVLENCKKEPDLLAQLRN